MNSEYQERGARLLLPILSISDLREWNGWMDELSES